VNAQKDKIAETAKRSFMSYQRRRRAAYWVMLIPFLTGFFLVYLGVYASSFIYSFQTINILPEGGFAQIWNGFANYRMILTEEPNFRNNLSLAVGEMLAFTLFIIIFSLFIAVVLNRKMRGRAFFRAMFFIPVILATGFVARAEMYSLVMQSMQAGMETSTAGSGSTSMFTQMDIWRLMYSMRFSPVMADYVLIAVNAIVDIINRSGVQILIFLAGIQSVSPAIYESADIDGASGWEKFWLITLPMISPLILVNVFYTIIDSLTRPNNLIMLQIEDYRIRAGGMGTASAMAWFYFLAVLLILAAAAAILRIFVYYQQRD
jgi:ABC-type sugar transport system permease subunit